MPLRPIAFRILRKKLEAAGFQEVSQKGSHVKFVKEDSGIILTAIVPMHKEIAIGTLRSILRQAKISPEEFDKL